MVVHVYPILNPPPSPSHPSGSSQCTALSTLSHASNLDWWSVSHMVIYTCLNAVLSNHLTLAFSHRVQTSVLYVSFADLHIVSSLPSFWIPYICINILYWCFSSWLTSFCIMGSSFIQLITNQFLLFSFVLCKTESQIALAFCEWVVYGTCHLPAGGSDRSELRILLKASYNGRSN